MCHVQNQLLISKANKSTDEMIQGSQKENLGSDQGQTPLFQNYKTEQER